MELFGDALLVAQGVANPSAQSLTIATPHLTREYNGHPCSFRIELFGDAVLVFSYTGK
jgi:hypothetical protein